jgi:hypothetical protein
MALGYSMELTRITKLLLWLLSKRPDVGNLSVRELEMTDYLLDLEEYSPDEIADLTDDPTLYIEFERDHLESCINLAPEDKRSS